MSTVKAPVSIPNSLDIRKGLSLSQEGLARMLNVSVKTISRWEKEALQPSQSEPRAKLSKLKEITELGHLIYTTEGLHEFLSTSLPIWNGRTGFELMQLGDFEPVIAALAADFEGTGF